MEEVIPVTDAQKSITFFLSTILYSSPKGLSEEVLRPIAFLSLHFEKIVIKRQSKSKLLVHPLSALSTELIANVYLKNQCYLYALDLM